MEMVAVSNNNVKESTATATETKKTKKKKGVLSRLWGAIIRLHGDDFEKRLQYISKEEAAVLSRVTRRSNSWRRMTRHMILLSVLLEAVAVGYAIMTTRSLDLNWKMRALRVLPMFLLPLLSSITYFALRSFKRMCEFVLAWLIKSFKILYKILFMAFFSSSRGKELAKEPVLLMMAFAVKNLGICIFRAKIWKKIRLKYACSKNWASKRFLAVRYSKRWQLSDSKNSIVASSANDLRQDKYAPINPEKLTVAAAGLSWIGSAFVVATAIVFGGATLVFVLVAFKLEVHNVGLLMAKSKKLERNSKS